MKLKNQKGTKKLEIAFHIFITLFAVGIIVSSFLGYEELERATMYLILGAIIGLSSLFRLIKLLR